MVTRNVQEEIDAGYRMTNREKFKLTMSDLPPLPHTTYVLASYGDEYSQDRHGGAERL